MRSMTLAEVVMEQEIVMLILGLVSPSMHTSEPDFTHVIKSTQPPIIERPHPSNLTRTSILRTNESGIRSFEDDRPSKVYVVPQPVVQTKEVTVGRARRTLTDDGSADVVHHIGIISPPASYSIVKRPSTQIRTTVTTSTTDQYEYPRVTTTAPPDFLDRSEVYVQPQRIESNIAQARSDRLVDGVLSSTQQTLIQDDDYDSRLRRPVQVKKKQSWFHLTLGTNSFPFRSSQLKQKSLLVVRTPKSTLHHRRRKPFAYAKRIGWKVTQEIMIYRW